jgi:hypothetical protein
MPHTLWTIPNNQNTIGQHLRRRVSLLDDELDDELDDDASYLIVVFICHQTALHVFVEQLFDR